MRIRKKHMGAYVIVSPTWVSNAHWAVRRADVSNDVLMATEAAALAWLGSHVSFKAKEDVDFQKFCDGERREFTVTSIERGAYMRSRLLVGDGDASWVDPDYLDMLSIYPGTKLYAKDGVSPLSDAKTIEDAKLFLMPKATKENVRRFGSGAAPRRAVDSPV